MILLFPPVKNLYEELTYLRNENERLNSEKLIREQYHEQQESLLHLQKKAALNECIVEKIYDSTVGEKGYCNICDNVVRVFLPFGNTPRENAECPYCGSLERHRLLWYYIKHNTNMLNDSIDTSIKVLHFAPETILQKKISKFKYIDYYPVDINPSHIGIRDVIDIESIKFHDNTFDYIICYHVLEHVADDLMAMKELIRVLKKDGIVFIEVPTNNIDTTYENPEFNTPELRLQHYGQDDHVRMYGNDFSQKLSETGFIVEEIDLSKDLTSQELYSYGISMSKTICSPYKCTIM